MRKRRRCNKKDECVEAKRDVSICDDADFIFFLAGVGDSAGAYHSPEVA